ncbi:MAG: hypothetical protein ACD_87C00283G0001 [uncultured bacterium]|nr:MAG: hypothetical protein ACD_87C00283G0001 [uncultured bacterium]
MFSPNRRVLRPFSLAGARKRAAILSVPFFIEKRVYSFFLPSGSTLISFRYISKDSGLRFRSIFFSRASPSRA